MTKKTKYSVGDRVKVRKNLKTNTRYHMEHDHRVADVFTGSMTKFAGHTVTIVGVTPEGKYHIKGSLYNWTDEMFEPDKQSIVIYRRGRSVFALDKNTGKKAEAKCSPEDAFDFYTGAKIAFDRLTENDTPFKIGDILVALPHTPYVITDDGWIGKVIALEKSGLLVLRGLGSDKDTLINFNNLDPAYFRPAKDSDLTAKWLKKVWELETK